MILPSPIAAVILDMDGTLHDTEIVYHRALKHAVASVGFEISDAFCHSLIGIPSRECAAMLRDHLGPAFPYAECDRHERAHREILLADSIPLKPGAAELIDFLLREAVPLAVATSASRHAAESQLGRSGLRSRLPVVVTRDDVARGKPHPDLFLLAAAELDIPPAACLAIEDSYNGIRAAHAAGMMTVMVPDILPSIPEIAALCVHVARDLHEVQAGIAALRRA